MNTKRDGIIVTPEGRGMAVVDPEASGALTESVKQLGQIVLQLGQVVGAMQRRIDELEGRQDQVSVRHEDVLRIQAQIRQRAGEFCERYQLTDEGSRRAVKAAIKRDILGRYRARDLHDLPGSALASVGDQIARWTSMRLVLARRAAMEEGQA